MISVVIQTVQLLGRRVLLKISAMSAALLFTGVLQVIPILFVLPLIRIITRPERQAEGLPRRMRRLFPEDTAAYLDNLIITTDTQTLITYTASLAITLLGLQTYATIRSKKSIDAFLVNQSNILANKLFNNYLKSDVFSYSDPITKIRSGCQALSTILQNTIKLLFSVMMFFMIAAIVIFIYPWPGLTSAIMILLSIALLTFVVQPKMNRILNRMSLAIANRGRLIGDSMRAIKEIRLLGREKYFFDRFLEDQIARQSEEETRQKFGTIMAVITMFLRYLGIAAGIVIALYTLPKADFGGFVMIFMMLGMRMSALSTEISQGANDAYKSFLVLGLHYQTMLKYDATQTASEEDKIQFRESIEFSNLYFRHSGQTDDEEGLTAADYEAMATAEEQAEEIEQPDILQNINLTIERGQFIGVVGKNGAGKSTILDLIAGLIAPTQGEVLIDGRVLQPADIRHWRAQVNYVIQKPHLIADSVLHNITLGLRDEEVDQKRLLEVLELSKLDQIIGHLAQGIETPVGSGGTKVSGGQAQRIVLARALYQARPILLLDEATRAIDAATEAEIMGKIATMRGERTIVIVTHRVQSLRQCDTIYLVEDKGIAAAGDYATLYETSELFRLFASGKKAEAQEDKKADKKLPAQPIPALA